MHLISMDNDMSYYYVWLLWYIINYIVTTYEFSSGGLELHLAIL